ncbi:MAG TPA: carboxylating nicotinate-nucleotide diphosphorylase [Spirochaetota bacterium]|nr:carboxylating nicotinate-nucleotide diphosphorylase [Spirochaetota bacterium]HQO40875.1 carboxylating nicotinate-nucleotide diphosphorylase [Spirochaetota bacterium]
MTGFSHIDRLIEMALFEDLRASGDVTADAIFRNENFSYRLVAKESGILCGIDIFTRVMLTVDPRIELSCSYRDRDSVKKGDIIADVSGPVKSVLKAERTALNLLSHLSGIATRTSLFVAETGGRCVILDTRKTLPGYREIQKYAVRCGGGSNHRMGLYDMVMIKDNHSDAAGGIAAAVAKIRSVYGSTFRVEVEVRNTEEVMQAVEAGADRIMLDNMSTAEMKKSVNLIAHRAETEASGNMTLERIGEVSMTGVDYISVGELTHSVRAFDFSLKAC